MITASKIWNEDETKGIAPQIMLCPIFRGVYTGNNITANAESPSVFQHKTIKNISQRGKTK